MQRDWNKILNDLQKSGLSANAYAAKNGLSSSTLDYQIRKATRPGWKQKRKTPIVRKPKKNGAHFVQINGHAPQIEIQTPGATIKVPADISNEQLRNILKALQP